MTNGKQDNGTYGTGPTNTALNVESTVPQLMLLAELHKIYFCMMIKERMGFDSQFEG